MPALPKLYDDVVMDHIKNARNYRSVEAPDLHAEGRNRLCGDHVTLTLRTAGDRIRDAAFQCECCGISMASASIMTAAVASRTLDEARQLAAEVQRAVEDVSLQAPEVGDVPTVVAVGRAHPARRRCALLPWVTLMAALDGRHEAHT
jgi:nitrogen fixation NifU-like protein